MNLFGKWGSNNPKNESYWKKHYPWGFDDEQTMDKHTRRYFSETFDHHHPGMEIGEAMRYMQQGADPSFMTSAIDDHFSGIERDFLRLKLLDEQYKRGGWE